MEPFKTPDSSINAKNDPFVYTILTMEGKSFLADSNYNVEIKQHTSDHDTFTIITSDDSLDSFEGYVLENSKNTLGKNIELTFYRFGEIKQYFSGIVTNILNKKNKEGGYGRLYITGYAPSIFLESGKNCQSFENKTLAQIISEIVQGYTQSTKIEIINPNTQYPIPYTVQYKESDYQFIKRLAARYGEYFYYDGKSMVFGNKVQPIVTLEENIDLIDVELELSIQSQDFNYMAYDSLSAEVKEKDSTSTLMPPKDNVFQSIAVNASRKVFQKKTNTFFTGTSYLQTERDLEEVVKRQAENRQHVTRIKGRSYDPGLKIGGRARIVDINSKPMETYRIIEIFHFHNSNEYYNEFVGVPDVFTSPYFDEEAYPISEEQPAKVIENNNVQGMIRVQFPWQEKSGDKSPWLRVVTPYAGKGKGLHILPEIGEEVIVGFDNSNAERPFVMGSMFNGIANAGFGGEGNYIKALQSGAGQFLRMNDKDGSLGLKDALGSGMNFNGIGDIFTNAMNTSNINAGESHTTGVGGNNGEGQGEPQSLLHMDNAGNIILDGKNSIVLMAENTITLAVGESAVVIEKDQIVFISQSIKVGAERTIDIEGKSEVTIESEGLVKISSKGPTRINGADIELNKR